MTSAAVRTKSQVTMLPSFSLYVTAANTERIRQAAEFGDSITIAGPKGPEAITKLRASGFEKPVMFDGTGYAGHDLAVEKWVSAQHRAGADRALLPGVFLPWDKDDDTQMLTVIAEQACIAADIDATLLVAIDGRWLARRHTVLADALIAAERPTALVLADARDPLAIKGAVAGLRSLAGRVPHLSILRCDHGGLGAVAIGGGHAAMGLSTSTRHFVATGMNAHRHIDNTARVFVRSVLDWYRAAEIAGWSSAGPQLGCPLQCCRGESLARYLDADLDATWHNMNALADFGEFVLNADPDDRTAEFVNACRSAVSRHGLAGIHGPATPKSQLTSWAFS
ncbi:MAG: hypothetical protein AB7V43_13905 [Acidimicrobiia bacterium]